MHRSPARLLVHIVWSTACRRAVLPPALDATLARLWGDSAEELGCSIVVAGAAADHVHVVARIAATARLSDLVQRLKGGSARDVNQHSLLPEPLRWQVGYWAESISPGAVAALAPYVRSQRSRHDDAHPAEAWQHAVL